MYDLLISEMRKRANFDMPGGNSRRRSRNATRKPKSFPTCVYRKLKLGRSGDEVRPGWRVN